MLLRNLANHPDCLINDPPRTGCGGQLFPWELSVLVYKLSQNISGDWEKIAEHEEKMTFDCPSSLCFIVLSLLDEPLWPWNEPWISFSGMWDQIGNQQCEQNFTAASLPRLDLESCCHPQQSVPFQSTEKLPAVGTASPGGVGTPGFLKGSVWMCTSTRTQALKSPEIQIFISWQSSQRERLL